MEYLTRSCPKCGPENFVGRKTTWGLSPEEVKAYRVREGTCSRCGQTGCKVGLDRSSPDARALDEVLKQVIRRAVEGLDPATKDRLRGAIKGEHPAGPEIHKQAGD